MRTSCPLCDGSVTVFADGRMARHRTSTGERCALSQRVAPPWDERNTREAVPGRSGGRCEWCKRRRATEMHHRKNRSQGGEWNPANILHLCNECHRRCTLNRSWGRALGLVVPQYENPETVPVVCEDLTTFQPTSMVTRKRGRR